MERIPACPKYLRIFGAKYRIMKITKLTVKIDVTITPLSNHSFVFNDKLINNEIEPGPANKGIAKGLNEISSLINDSSFTSELTSFLCCELSNKKPDLEMIIPPANFNA